MDKECIGIPFRPRPTIVEVTPSCCKVVGKYCVPNGLTTSVGDVVAVPVAMTNAVGARITIVRAKIGRADVGADTTNARGGLVTFAGCAVGGCNALDANIIDFITQHVFNRTWIDAN